MIQNDKELALVTICLLEKAMEELKRRNGGNVTVIECTEADLRNLRDRQSKIIILERGSDAAFADRVFRAHFRYTPPAPTERKRAIDITEP